MWNRGSAVLWAAMALMSCGGAKHAEPAAAQPAGTASAASAQDTEKDSKIIGLALKRGQEALRDGDLKTAEAQFLGILDRNKNHVAATYYLGVVAEKGGRNDEAEVRYRRALELDPDMAEAAASLGALLLAAEKPADALPFLRTAVRKNPSDARARTNLGVALAATNDKDGAADQFRLVLKLSGDHALVIKAATLLAGVGAREEALRALAGLVVSARDDEAQLTSVARAFDELKGFQECVDAFDKAIARESHAALLVRRGVCKHGLDDDKGARDDFDKATKTEVGYAPGWYHLGDSLGAAGDKAGALKAFAKCIEVAPGTEIAARAQTKMDELSKAKPGSGKKKAPARPRPKPGGTSGNR